jgi:putrescine importer
VTVKIPAVSLKRRLNTVSVCLFGLAYICPTVVVSTFGILSTSSGGAVASAYLVATLAILLSAFSYARMAARYPEAGSAYTYVTRTANSTAGFLAGWVLALDYLFVPMVICLFTAKAIEIVLPAVSYRVWVGVIAGFTTMINVLGIQVANRVNLTIMLAQLAVIAVLIVLCIVYLGRPSSVVPTWSAEPLWNAHTTLALTLGSASFAAYSFLGFDAVTTLSEESLTPTRSIPFATVFAAGASGMIYVATSYLMGLVHPSLSFKDVDNGGYEVVAMVSGDLFLPIFAVIMVAFMASVLCAQAGSSRLLYAMGRDGVLPRSLGRLAPRLRTPVVGILVTGLMMGVGAWIDLESAASCVNFGAFSAFLAVNVCVIVDHISGRRELPGGLGKLLQAAAGAAAAGWLLWSLRTLAVAVGLIWLGCGVGYWGLWARRAGSAVAAR